MGGNNVWFETIIINRGDSMKKVVTLIVCVFSVLFCACDNKDSLISLNRLHNSLVSEFEELNEEYKSLKDKTGNLSSEEMISLINKINLDVIKSNVMITSESRGTFTGTSISSGSGTIIKEDAGRYYVLTNNHVIYTLNPSRTNYYIYDYLNNEYVARVEFYDPEYDMALLSFNKAYETLRVAEFASEDPKVRENIIAIGQPLGKRNVITFGEVLRYDFVECEDCADKESNIEYECIYYDAPTNNGNSGGMLINYDYKIVGIVTYGFTIGGEFAYGAGSSVSKIIEFLTLNDFEVGDLYE